MIEPTDEMVAAFWSGSQWPKPGDLDVRRGLAAVLAIAERQWQEQYGDAFQAGWWRGQHELCPRCGDALDREVREEQTTVKVKWVCRKCGGPLAACFTCGEPSQCGDGFCGGCA